MIEFKIGNNVKATELLYDGPTSTTYKGVDLSTQKPLTIKKVPIDAIDAKTLSDMKARNSRLSKFTIPDFIPLMDVISEKEAIYIIRPYTTAAPLNILFKNGRLPIENTITMGIILFRILSDLHNREIIHKNINPQCIFIDESEEKFQCKLSDFWLIDPIRNDGQISPQTISRARYMAPEQTGLIKETISPSSDIYSLGMILFECLSGFSPIKGDNINEILNSILSVNPPDLHQEDTRISKDLNSIVLRCIEKHPNDRYQSAQAVVKDLIQVSEYMATKKPSPHFIPGLYDKRMTLTDPAFISRKDEIKKLKQFVEFGSPEQNELIFIEAESGLGKSKLIEELIRSVEKNGSVALLGMGQTQVAKHPFQDLSSIVKKIIQLSASNERFKNTIIQQTKGYHDTLCVAFPELHAILKSEQASKAGPEQFAETRTLNALCRLLGALSILEKPTAIILDDCQWADDMTIKMLQEWQRIGKMMSTGGQRISLIAAFRSEEVSETHALRKIIPNETITLKPFNKNEVKTLVESMAGELPEKIVTLITELSQGVPFMISAILRGFIEARALVSTEKGWAVDEKALSNIQSSQHAATFLTKRIELLPKPVKHLLSIGAVMGKRFDLIIASTLADLPISNALKTVKEAQKKQLVWLDEKTDQCQFVHDKIRESFLNNFSAEEQKTFHRMLATHLEKVNKDRNFELAYHYDAAGDFKSAYQYALEAGTRARQQYALEAAEQQYRICERAIDHIDKKAAFEVSKELGQVLMLRGKYDEAGTRFEKTLNFTNILIEKVEILGKLGELAFKRGNMTTAVHETEKAIGLLGVRIPSNIVMFMIGLSIDLVIQAFHSLFPNLILKPKTNENKESDLMKVRLFHRLAYSYWFKFGQIQAMWANLKGTNLVEKYPPTPELGQAYSDHGVAMATLGHFIPWFFIRGERFIQKSIELREKFNDEWGKGQSLSFYSLLLYCASRFEDCVVQSRKAIAILERMGDYWELEIARWQGAGSLYRLGRLEEAAKEAVIIHQTGLAIGDILASGISLDVLVRATKGNVPLDVLKRELDQPRDDTQPQVQVMMAEGIRRLWNGQYDSSIDILKKAFKTLADGRCWNSFVSAVPAWLVTASRLALQNKKLFSPITAQEDFKELKKLARRARWLSHFSPNDIPHAYREGAIVAAMSGEASKSKRYFNYSLKWANRHKAEFEKALTLRERGKIGRKFNWAGYEEDLRKGQEKIDELRNFSMHGINSQDKTITLSLVDRFENIVNQGGQIARALSSEVAFKTLKNAATTLIRGEECHIYQVSGKDNSHYEPIDNGPSEIINLNEFGTYIQTKREAVIISENEMEEFFPSQNSIQVKSVIASPIFTRGELKGFFILIHKNIKGLFNDEEKRLANYLSTITGAALENAEGFNELQNLNSTLEARVEDRTKELKLANAKLEQLTFTDPLTKLLNRRGLDNILSHEIQINRRKNLDILALLIDLDNFKQINDKLGYSSGDMALKETAQQIRDTLRDNDIGARVGGDEFLVIFKDTRIAEGLQIAERLCAKIAKTLISGPDGTFHISASLGLVRSTSESPSVDDLLAQTHIVLKRSKKDGKGRVTMSAENDIETSSIQTNKIDALDQFRKGESLYCVKMPIINVKNDQMIGQELLIRSTTKGFELPDEIFGLCRESDILATVDFECYKTGVKEIMAHPSNGRFFINIFPYSIVHFPSAKFLEPFNGQFVPGKVVIEISEQQIIGDPSLLSDASAELKKLGFLIAMDDVGFGRSNLETLIALEPNVIKIDKRFVQGISSNKNLQLFMKRTLNVLKTSSVDIVAEGIENKEDLNTLLSLGIKYGQGYLWGKPQPQLSPDINKAA